ncbi:alpha/beta hydrolase [Staphylococcus chromogenes]|uniref:Alpha/beta hydrolase n=1 Tax=Staphylococcus chromogenes TaxID=46126 RepID=A0ABD5AXE9_STACR|nr:alpha/beta hydrolase [Staphylococcus chromogenes]KDP13972.1 hypothetical protein SCHR_02340 [Staphylococcus chromogenes MU 970]MCD9059530.1 alpha/beta hydrolase [Staphylococcus chromogenes]MCD9061533.1 alpha/beta hydrolase [Staphylococcus chromogenes]MCD9070148.1 alpha/beta hydrolase [Staphylococcus chromogenes]MCE4960909.1 alpha/beta hydrolase [Staphylococcus chromogenes]
MGDFTTKDRRRIHLKKMGQGVPLVLIHDLYGNIASFDALAERLKPHFTLICYDLRGHGRSSKPNHYEMSNHLQDLVSLLDHLQIKKAHFLGHGMGGIIASLLACEASDYVQSLTLIGAYDNNIVNGMAHLMNEHREMTKGFTRLEATLVLFPYIYHNKKAALKWYQQQRIYSYETENDMAVATRALHTYQEYQKEYVNKFTVPTLVIEGAFDPFRNNPAQRPDVNARHIDYKEYKHSGHAPHIEEIEKFLVDFETFIKNI